eukprot:gene34650-5750_t
MAPGPAVAPSPSASPSGSGAGGLCARRQPPSAAGVEPWDPPPFDPSAEAEAEEGEPATPPLSPSSRPPLHLADWPLSHHTEEGPLRALRYLTLLWLPLCSATGLQFRSRRQRVWSLAVLSLSVGYGVVMELHDWASGAPDVEGARAAASRLSELALFPMAAMAWWSGARLFALRGREGVRHYNEKRRRGDVWLRPEEEGWPCVDCMRDVLGASFRAKWSEPEADSGKKRSFAVLKRPSKQSKMVSNRHWRRLRPDCPSEKHQRHFCHFSIPK